MRMPPVLYKPVSYTYPMPRPAGAGTVDLREHEHAPPRISREGVIFREPPDIAGARVSTHNLRCP